MLRVAGRRLSSSAVGWRLSSQTATAFVSGGSHPLFITNNSDDDSSSDFASKSPASFFLNSKIPSLVRGFSSEALAPGNDIGGRFVYASLIRLLILKFVLSMSASKDVFALASLEVHLSNIEPGTTVTVKWRGKPIFIRRRTEYDIKLANSVDIQSLRDPQ
ncbi:hypothetical protein ACFX2I_013183 [Malus domestica]